MAVIRFSTDRNTWQTASISYPPNAGGGISDLQSLYSSGSVVKVIFADYAWVAQLDNGMILKSDQRTASVGVFTPYVMREGVDFTANPISYTSIIYKNNIWLSSTTGGILKTSTDAITWTTQQANFGSTDINGLCHGNNTWVAVGNSGQIRTSTDAVTWTTRTSNFAQNLWAVEFGASQFVAVGASISTILRSTDAVTWRAEASASFVRHGSFASTWGWADVKYTADNQWLFRSQGIRPFPSGLTQKTSDFITWTRNALPRSDLTIFDFRFNRITYDGTRYYIANGSPTNTQNFPYQSSDNGTSWSQISLIATWVSSCNIATASGYVIVTGPGVTWDLNLPGMALSTNRTTWQSLRNIYKPTNTSYSTGDTTYSNYTNGVWNMNNSRSLRSRSYLLPVEGEKFNIYSANNKITYTNTLTNDIYTDEQPRADSTGTYKTSNIVRTNICWTTVTSNFGATNIKSIAYGNGVWVAVGDSGQIRTSTDTVTWATRTSNFGTTNINHVAYNNIWVAVGNTGQLQTSTDATTWNTQTSNFGTTNINRVAYGNSIWVAVGDSGQLRTSTDATTWNTQTSNFGTTNIRSVAYNNGVWVAVGDSGQIRTSINAIDWTTRTSNFGVSMIKTVSYRNNQWVASGDNGVFIRSTDTVTWTTTYNSMAATSNEIISNGDGFSSVNNGGSIYHTTDGLVWVTQTPNMGATNVNGIAYGNGIWVAVGDSGQIRTSVLHPGINDLFYTSPYTFLLGNRGGLIRWEASSGTVTRIQTGITDNFRKMSRNGNRYIIQGDSDFYYSTNGTTWVTVDSSIDLSDVNDIINLS